MIRDHKQKIANDLARADARRDFLNDAVFRIARHAGIGQKIPQLWRTGEGSGKITQLF